MLPEISLDNAEFEDIVKKTRSEIAGIYPEWTDFNYHDPGVTLIELFAFLKEAQQFYMDQVGNATVRKFAQLLGLHSQQRKASKTVAEVAVNWQEDQQYQQIPAGMQFYLGDVCYETVSQRQLPRSRVTGLIVREIGESTFTMDLSTRTGPLHFYPFGMHPKKDNEFIICLDRPLPVGIPLQLSLYLTDEAPIKRNLPDENFVPISQMELLAKGQDGYASVSMEDGTIGMIQDGDISFTLERDMVISREEELEGYFLKLKLTGNQFDVAPILSAVRLNLIALTQQESGAVLIPTSHETEWNLQDFSPDFYREEGEYLVETDREHAQWISLCREEKQNQKVLGWGNGFPGQEMELSQNGILAESLVLLVASTQNPKAFRRWTQVEDFDRSTPESCHYVVNEAENKILFGDGIQGRVPETEIRLASWAVSLGNQGNITRNKPLICPQMNGQLSAVSFLNGAGGKAPETVYETMERYNAQKHPRQRAVSAEDYESLIKATPGLRIQECKVLEDTDCSSCSNQLKIVVRPYADSGYGILTEAYRKNIQRWLRDKRLIGTSISLMAPEYIEAEVYVEVSTYSHYQQGKHRIEQAIREYFQTLSGFGAIVRRGQLYGLIEGMEEVSELHMLSVNAQGSRIRRNHSGDLLLPPTGVLVLKKVECIVVNR